MFGVVPKSLWKQKAHPDANNMVPLCMRSLLIEDGHRLTLVDCGIGNKQSEKFFSRYFLFGEATLDRSLAQHGFHRDDITDVILTHLHFDHCGGAVKTNEKGLYELTFKNAIFWSNEKHWKWATEPNPREKASFLTENILPISESGQLQFVPPGDFYAEETPIGFGMYFVHGHTEAQMLPCLQYKGHKIVFVCDLIPTHAHIPLAYIPSYDTRPLLSLTEKERFLSQACEENILMFSAHDAQYELYTAERFKNNFRLKNTYSANDLF